MNDRLQKYYNYFVEYFGPTTSSWYNDLVASLNIIRAIKSELTIPNHDPIELILQRASNQEITSIEGFFQKYLFEVRNKLGSIGRGAIFNTDDSPHRDTIEKSLTGEFLIFLMTNDKIKVNERLKTVMDVGRNYPATRIRLMRALFPGEIAAVDAPGKLSRLVDILQRKLGISITGTELEKHEQLMHAINGEDELKQIFNWKLYEMLDNKLSLKRAIVYYGAPGTGKTFNARIKAEELILEYRLKVNKAVDSLFQVRTIQFHPSYAYEDFMEGIRPSGEKELKVYNGTFKQFCKDSGAKEIALYGTDNFLSNSSFADRKFDFSKIRISELTTSQFALLNLERANIGGDITLQEAIEPAVFIIDEINRAELSRVFGELMFSLEYRGYSGKIKTQYAYLTQGVNAPNNFFWEEDENWFFVPQNIYVIGTMNNIDRSVDSFDFALRRRFMWEEIEPEYDLVKRLLPLWGGQLQESLKKLNDAIVKEKLLGKDYRIGHAYILNIQSIEKRFDGIAEARKFIWAEFIKALLEEYLRGLGDEQQMEIKMAEFQKSFDVNE
jgi:hypothetical protein